jgi:hypothetical protein
MLVDFNSMPDNARVWVYQSSRCLTPEEQSRLSEAAASFVSEWTAHQADLKASVLVADGFFVVFTVDESFNEASGCSIDKKVAFMKKAEQNLGVSFFERMNFTWVDSNHNIRLSRLSDLDQLLASSEINTSTVVHDNLISNMKQFREQWKSPLEKTWMMRFVRTVTG